MCVWRQTKLYFNSLLLAPRQRRTYGAWLLEIAAWALRRKGRPIRLTVRKHAVGVNLG
jgi:hypothetical protein